MKKPISIIFLIFLLFSFLTPISQAKEEEPKWAVQMKNERKGKSPLAIKSLAVATDKDFIMFRCESWGNWNLGYDSYHIRVYINTEGKKKPGKEKTFLCDIMQMLPDCNECLFLTMKDLEMNAPIICFPMVAYIGSEGILIFIVNKADIRLENDNFSLLFEITSSGGSGAIDYSPADHNYALYDPNGPAPDPYFYVATDPLDLGQIPQNRDTVAKVIMANMGAGTIQVDIASSIPELKLQANTYTLKEYEVVEFEVTIHPDTLSVGLHRESVTFKGMEKEKKVLLQFEILIIPSIFAVPMDMDFGSVVIGESKTKALMIQNENPGPVVGTIQPSHYWISVSKTEFNDNTIDLEVTVSDFPKTGKYEGKILIDSNGGKLEINVTVKVTDIVRIDIQEINFGEIDADHPQELKKTFKVYNDSQSRVEIQFSSDKDWLHVFPASSKLSAVTDMEVEVEINTDIIRKKVQTNKGYIQIRYVNGIQTIPVSVTVVKYEPKLNWLKEKSDPTTFDKKIVAGQQIQIRLVFENTGSATLKGEVKLANQNEWKINTSSFTLAKAETTEIIASLDTTGLENRVLSNILQVTSNGGNVSIPLEVQVIAIPMIKIKLWIGKKTAFVNEDPIRLDEAPYIQSGSTLVPLRFIGEAFKANVEWIKEGKGKIIITMPNHKILLSIGDLQAFVDNQEYTLSVPPEIKNGRTFVPLRFIGEGLGAKIEWKPENQEILITMLLNN